MSKVIRRKVDLNNPPKLTVEQKARLDALAAMPDELIDYSDEPPLDDAFWQKAVRNPFYKPVKVHRPSERLPPRPRPSRFSFGVGATQKMGTGTRDGCSVYLPGCQGYGNARSECE